MKPSESSKNYVMVPDGAGFRLRDPTPEEAIQARAMEQSVDTLIERIDKDTRMLASIRRTCKHTVLYSSPGFEYDVIFCVACQEVVDLA